ncbi:MAG: hypothetical protein HY689_06130 [Chloroflexi bacterium]|nr:hypothetical protein [Chloroflexota bacterium]
MRATVTLLTLAAGLTLAAVSYFFLAAPLGLPAHEGYSNPRMPYAPVLFILGVVLVFLTAVVYELLPEQGNP